MLWKLLFHDLFAISLLNLPWILSSDFNAILNSDEYRSGNVDHYSIKSKNFNEFISKTNSLIWAFGPTYAWFNNQNSLQGDGPYWTDS